MSGLTGGNLNADSTGPGPLAGSSAYRLLDGRRRPRPPKLYRMAEIVAYSGVSRQTIHNYTTMGLITESQRTRGGQRLYGEEVFERLRRITELKGRMTLREIRKLLEEEDRKG